MHGIRHVVFFEFQIGAHGDRDIAVHIVIDFVGAESSGSFLVLLADLDVAGQVELEVLAGLALGRS